ncbi:MAG: isopentenyl phosphate kinase family protein [Anaerolineae bacterium]|nr:isopentenyl phosphate kinase family protein [Anaerolineae bacterium]
MTELVFLKLGGSLITDKAHPFTPRLDCIRPIAREVRRALDGRPALSLLLGHGSGSFGHQAAAQHGTRRGVHSAAQWRGYADVAAAAARLNRIVMDELLAAGVPAVSLQPSASAACRDGVLVHLETGPVRLALERGLVPLLYGDVAFDERRGGTIISTEDIFVYLAARLFPARILLAGKAAGVLDPRGSLVPHISPATFPAIASFLSGSHTVDVTGGMADKVAQMVALVQQQDVEVEIFSGRDSSWVYRSLVEPDFSPGTRIARRM